MDQRQREQCQAALPDDAVAERTQSGKKLSYVEAWWVINRLNLIFGNGEWGSTIETLDYVHTESGNDGKHAVTYRAIVRIDGPFKSQTGVGFATNTSKSLGDAHENAGKSAESDALKRAAVKLGLSLGLALYEKPDEETGERTHVQDSTAAELVAAFAAAKTPADWTKAKADTEAAWPKLKKGDRDRLRAARDEAVKRIRANGSEKEGTVVS